jgi:lysophospholipase L1-like esterase
MAALLLCACGSPARTPGPALSVSPGTAHYLALGDSYTIGTGSSSPSKRWPEIIARRLEAATGRPVNVTNLGVGGFTTADLIDVELPHLKDARWDYISVLVGVNDFFQGYDEPHYHARLVQVYDAVAALNLPPGRVLAVSIPDYSYTPEGASSGRPSDIINGLRLFNATARVMAEMRGFTWVDIFEVSRSQAGTPGWIARDGLHPGDRQYQAWADHIWDHVGPSWRTLGSPTATPGG